MFKFLYNGVIYTADTLEDLQKELVSVGFEGNVIEQYAQIEEEYKQQIENSIDVSKSETEYLEQREEELQDFNKSESSYLEQSQQQFEEYMEQSDKESEVLKKALEEQQETDEDIPNDEPSYH